MGRFHEMQPMCSSGGSSGAGEGYLLHCGYNLHVLHGLRGSLLLCLENLLPSFFMDSTYVSTGLFLIPVTPVSHSCQAASLPFLRCWLRNSTMPCSRSIGTGWSQQFPSHSSSLLPVPGHQYQESMAEFTQADGHVWSRLRCHHQQEGPSSEGIRVFPTDLTCWDGKSLFLWCPCVKEVNIQINLLIGFILVYSLVFIVTDWIFSVKIYLFCQSRDLHFFPLFNAIWCQEQQEGCHGPHQHSSSCIYGLFPGQTLARCWNTKLQIWLSAGSLWERLWSPFPTPEVILFPLIWDFTQYSIVSW